MTKAPSPGWSRAEMARRLAAAIEPGWVVNLGIGLPTEVANHLDPGAGVVLHSENGLLGMGPAPPAGQEDPDLVNAGKQPVTLQDGGSYFHHADSFAMIRGGHLDLCVLGAFQVSAQGDLANWSTGAADAIPAVGGAMDLAVGARRVWVLMEHTTRGGEPKLVAQCSYPLTAPACVNRVLTPLADLERVGASRWLVRALAPGTSMAELQARTGFALAGDGEAAA